MSALSETLESIRAKIAAVRAKNQNLSEEDTKLALINPVLCALGWTVGNLEDVRCEYRRTPTSNPVDYALLVQTDPKLLLEAKALGQPVEGGKWGDQIMGYAGNAGIEWVILTNGDEYRIYNACAKVPLEQKLFRSVRLTNPADPTEETLALLSKERFNALPAQWQMHFADRQVHAAIKNLFSESPESLSHLVSFVKKHVTGLNPKEIKSSLARLRVGFLTRLRVEFPVDHSKPADEPEPSKSAEGVAPVDYIAFWKPIRTESNGLFAGKPADRRWIAKWIRGICLSLVVLDHECRVEIEFNDENRQKQRDKVLELLRAGKYPRELHESPKCVSVRFSVLDKGIKDRDNWPEIHEKLKSLGEQIHKALMESDV